MSDFTDAVTIAVDDIATEAKPKVRRRAPVSAIDSLVGNCLRRSLSPVEKRLLRRRVSFALVIEVPGPGWVHPMTKAIRSYGPWEVVSARDGSDRKSRSDQGNDDIAVALSSGKRVVGIAPAPKRHLPSALTGSADLWVRIRPSDLAISDTILSSTGRRPRDLPSGLWAGLDVADIASAIRFGDHPDKSVARLRAATEARSIVDPNVATAPAFETLCGYGPAKEWGDALIDDLTDWRAGKLAFDAISSRAVLASAPGLGKTTFARSLARAAGLPLVATSVSTWFATSSGYLDGITRSIDDVFAAARARSPSILFLDEIDAIPNRATLDSRAREWWTTIVTHILLALDSTVSGENQKTIVIGATNHADKLDAALVRPGRLDRIIYIGLPDAAARAGILRAHLGDDLHRTNLLPAARLAYGMTGADLAQAVKTARRTARVSGRTLAINDLVNAVAPADVRGPLELWRAAVHESGHAIGQIAAGWRLDFVSIVRRGDNGGATSGEGFGRLPRRGEIETYVVFLLCGRAAEEIVLGEASAGAGGAVDSDLARAGALLCALHSSFGLGGRLLWRGPPEEAAHLTSIDPALRAQIDAELDMLHARALALIREKRQAVEAIAKRLLKKRHLAGDEIKAIAAKSRE
jgi:cell division protease FtsH